MKLNKFLLTFFVGVSSFYSYAKSNDLLQEVKIQAVRQSADIKNNQITFYGPVEVTQGSIHITADELKAYSKGKNGQRVLVATGEPATYKQTLDDGRPAAASAKKISYNLTDKTLTLLGDATLDQDGSQVTGNRIRYNINRQELIAESKGNGRVITIIQPQNYQEEDGGEIGNPSNDKDNKATPEVISNDKEQPVS